MGGKQELARRAGGYQSSLKMCSKAGAVLFCSLDAGERLQESSAKHSALAPRVHLRSLSHPLPAKTSSAQIIHCIPSPTSLPAPSSAARSNPHSPNRSRSRSAIKQHQIPHRLLLASQNIQHILAGYSTDNGAGRGELERGGLSYPAGE